jgi:hypothetical protein
MRRSPASPLPPFPALLFDFGFDDPLPSGGNVDYPLLASALRPSEDKPVSDLDFHDPDASVEHGVSGLSDDAAHG